MTKADWLDFFEAINGRSATEEEIAAALAAGEFQDDAPAVETAPTQEAPAPAQPQPTFASAQERNHSQLSLVPKKRNHSRLLRVHKTRQRKLLCKCSGSPSTTNLCGCSSCSSTRSAKSSSATTSWFCECSRLVLLTVNLFNQVKTFNLSMDKP